MCITATGKVYQSQFYEAIIIMFTDELHSIYEPFSKYYKHQYELHNEQLLNKWFIRYFILYYH